MHCAPLRLRAARSSPWAATPALRARLSLLALLFAPLLFACGDGEHGATTTIIKPARTRPGAVRINGTLNVCPEIAEPNVSPLETAVGSTIQLEAVVWDLDDLPAPLAVQWLADNGWSASGLTTTFPCSETGTVVIVATVSDGDVACSRPSDASAGAANSVSVEVACSEAEITD